MRVQDVEAVAADDPGERAEPVDIPSGLASQPDERDARVGQRGGRQRLGAAWRAHPHVEPVARQVRRKSQRKSLGAAVVGQEADQIEDLDALAAHGWSPAFGHNAERRWQAHAMGLSARS